MEFLQTMISKEVDISHITSSQLAFSHDLKQTKLTFSHFEIQKYIIGYLVQNKTYHITVLAKSQKQICQPTLLPAQNVT